MMPMDVVKLVDTNGNLHSLTKFQVRIIKHINISHFHDTLMTR